MPHVRRPQRSLLTDNGATHTASPCYNAPSDLNPLVIIGVTPAGTDLPPLPSTITTCFLFPFVFSSSSSSSPRVLRRQRALAKELVEGGARTRLVFVAVLLIGNREVVVLCLRLWLWSHFDEGFLRVGSSCCRGAGCGVVWGQLRRRCNGGET